MNKIRHHLFLPIIAVLALLATTACAPRYKAHIDLGETKELTALYSYPNKEGTTQTLAETIEHYLQQTVTRDGLGRTAIRVDASNDLYSASMQGDSQELEDYVDRVPEFLAIGGLAYVGARTLEKQPLWQSDWRFFLPLGLSVTQQRSVQLLHFPPDYSLPDQDYLNSKTSQRWESLLVVNGAPSGEVARYEAIVDIAPIAAPASDGSKLEGTYSYFRDYAHKLLAFLAGPSDGSGVKPVVAYGSPVHAWVKDQFGVTLDVLETGYLPLGVGISVPALGANHPSYFWYAAEESCDDGWDVMRQDLIAARWQLEMSATPEKDADSILHEATAYWDARDAQICALTIEQASDCKDKPIKKCALVQSPAHALR